MSADAFAAETARARDFLRAAAADGASVAPRGRGSRMRRHRPRAAPDRWLECGAFRGIVWLDAADQTCEAGAGTAPAELDAELAPHGLMLAVDAPGPADGTLGGLFLAPDLSLLHGACGPPRDHALGGSWMLADGSVARTGARVVKSVAGYDLTRLFIGSRGLLAACLTLTLRLQPRPRGLRAARVADPARLRGSGLPDPLWHFQDAAGAAWAAWDGFIPAHETLSPCAAEEFHAARARVLGEFAALPARVAHAAAPERADGPMDWSALQQGAGAGTGIAFGAVRLPARGAPSRLDAIAAACAPDGARFAADAEEA